MLITKIKINHLRVINDLEITPESRINLILGDNGAGKTTLLESIYLLARNKSFRQKSNKNLITDNSSNLSVTASINYSNGSYRHIGLVKTSTTTQFSVNGQQQKKLSTLAKSLPLGIVTPNIHKLIEDGPDYRRKLIDWGVFHVEQDYALLVKKYNKALSQRNSTLIKHSYDVKVWDKLLVKYAEAITEKRLNYIHGLSNSLIKHSNNFIFSDHLKVVYKKGWNEEFSYEENLAKKLDMDIKRGYTSIGPHRANLLILYKDQLAVEVLSRGQQKLLGTLLVISQLAEVSSKLNDSPILLLDDIFSELDESNSKNILEVIRTLKMQTFLTSIDVSKVLSSLKDIKMFHVEQGKIV